MSEVRDVSFAIRAAEEAAGAGDFLTAEQYLSRAVELEEVSFGPMHAELASILNNLGVVYERLDRPDKAEACYRRAYAIAKASLPPGVFTGLEDFSLSLWAYANSLTWNTCMFFAGNDGFSNMYIAPKAGNGLRFGIAGAGHNDDQVVEAP